MNDFYDPGAISVTQLLRSERFETVLVTLFSIAIYVAGGISLLP